MKLSKIARILRKYKTADVITQASGRQWLYIGAAAYAMDGVPRIAEASELMAVMDVPPSERDGYDVRFTDGDGWEELLDESADNDITADLGGVLIQWGTVTHLPIVDAGGAVVWISELYTVPFADDTVTYAVRRIGEREYVAVRRGLSLIAVLARRRITPEMWAALDEVARRGIAELDDMDEPPEDDGSPKQEWIG